VVIETNKIHKKTKQKRSEVKLKIGEGYRDKTFQENGSIVGRWMENV
jgi:hypothetical protein